LATGECSSGTATVQVVSNNFEVQTSAQIFAGKKCFKAESVVRAQAPIAQHLTSMSGLQEENNHHWLYAGALVLAAGIAYSLKNKTVKFRR
jgi:hypothetical protein